MSRHNNKRTSSRKLSPAEYDTIDNVVSIRKHHRHHYNQDNHLNLRKISPLTQNQEKVFEAYDCNKNIVCCGAAGSGKSFILLYKMLDDLLNTKQYKKLIIIKSAVPSRNSGFLPGNEQEKMRIYELCFEDMFSDLFGRGDSYQLLKKKELVEFKSTGYVRGSTWNDSLILFDEFQNASFKELNTIITRTGQNSRIFFSGDIVQSDMVNKDPSGFIPFLQVLSVMNSFDVIEFTINDCVRSGLTKEYLYACHKLNIWG